MKKSILAAAALCALLGTSPLYAKGCLRGAAAGAVVGHMAHHHAVAGAAAGCALAHHHYAHKAKAHA